MPADEKTIQRALTGFAPVWKRVSAAEPAPETAKKQPPEPPKPSKPPKPFPRKACCPLLPAAAVILAAGIRIR